MPHTKALARWRLDILEVMQRSLLQTKMERAADEHFGKTTPIKKNPIFCLRIQNKCKKTVGGLLFKPPATTHMMKQFTFLWHWPFWGYGVFLNPFGRKMNNCKGRHYCAGIEYPVRTCRHRPDARGLPHIPSVLLIRENSTFVWKDCRPFWSVFLPLDRPPPVWISARGASPYRVVWGVMPLWKLFK